MSVRASDAEWKCGKCVMRGSVGPVWHRAMERGRSLRGGRARGRNASFSHREKRMRLSVAGIQWRRDEIRFAGRAGAGDGGSNR